MKHWSDDLVDSPGFCTRPFFHAYIGQNGHTNVCCLNTKQTYGNINHSSFDQVYSKNNSQLTEFRKQFINTDRLPDSCSACRDSVQAFYSKDHIRDTKKFLRNFATPEDLINNEKIFTYDVRFTNLCNIRCHYCHRDASSRFAAKLYRQGKTKYILQAIPENNVQQILKRFEDNIMDVDQFYFAGGEPLIMKEHYELLDICMKYNRTNIKLQYNSNMTRLGIKDYNVLDYWKHFTDIGLNASIDAGWEQFEFIRDGAVWNDVVENMRIVKELPNVNTTITPTMAFWNLEGIAKVYKYLVENNLLNRQRTPFGGEILDHEFLRPGVLPKHFKQRIVDLYNTEYKDYPELQVILRLLEPDLTHLLPKTKEFIEKLEQEKNCDFFTIFPELKGIFDGVS